MEFMMMGRRKQQKFLPDETSYYIVGRRQVNIYIGNEISGIHDPSIPQRDKLIALVKGFLKNDPRKIALEYGLFGTKLLNGCKFIKVYHKGKDIDEPVFSIVSNQDKTPTGKHVYALFYVKWKDQLLRELDANSTQLNEEANDHVKWLLNFFKKHSKRIPATDDEISKLKEVVDYVRRI